VNGKCAVPSTPGGTTPDPYQPPIQSTGDWISGIPNDWLMYGGIGLLALLLLSKKR
jgi:hypothetical protein